MWCSPMARDDRLRTPVVDWVWEESMMRPRRDETVKPPCQPGTRTIFSIVIRVDRALRHGGLTTQADEFLERALACRTCDELVALGAEYVAFEEEAPRES